jgi:hypothetical protein
MNEVVVMERRKLRPVTWVGPGASEGRWTYCLIGS